MGSRISESFIAKQDIPEFPNMPVEQPLVSIIVNIYNHEKYLADCLNGILEQVVDFNYEILLGEDNSQDGSRKICEDYAKKYPDKIRLFLHDRKNVFYINGIATGRFNFLYSLSKSRGKYVALCPGDDFWESTDKLQAQIDFLQQNLGYHGSYHDTDVMYEGQANSRRPYRLNLPKEIDAENSIDINSPFHTSSFVFRNDNIYPLPYWYQNIFSADMALFFLVACKGKLKYIPNLKSVYRKNEGGLTMREIDNKLVFVNLNRILMLSYFDEHTDQKYEHKIKSMIATHLNLLYGKSHLFKSKTLLSQNFKVIYRKIFKIGRQFKF